MGFKDNLKTLRAAAGYRTAREFAQALDIPYSRYINYEGAKASEPPYAELLKIAKCLHVSTDELLSNEIDNDSIMITFMKEALGNTPFEIRKVDKDNIIVYMKSKNLVVSMDRRQLISIVEKELENMHDTMNEILGNRISLSLKMAFLFNSDLVDPSTRSVLMEDNIYNTKLKNLTFPLLMFTEGDKQLKPTK